MIFILQNYKNIERRLLSKRNFFLKYSQYAIMECDDRVQNVSNDEIEH